ncbi:MAG: tetratricopeptide repeat protein [Thalassotalea sp.]
MKNAYISALFFSLCFSNLSSANDFNKGIYELNRGEFHAAIAEFAPLVEDNYAPAQYQMAKLLLDGNGTQKDTTKAVELLYKASKQNYQDAQFALSVLYSEGKVVNQNLTMAFELMQKAALKEMPSAQFNLGVMYAQGSGVKQDNYQATRWYKKAADQNYALAQFNLALMYFEGKGVEKSDYWSYVWNSVAAQGGYKNALKSRDMDERNLSAEQIKVGREEAYTIYAKLVRKQDMEAKIAAEALTF